MNKKLQVDKAVDQREKVIKVLDTLTEREQAVMKLRFGLEDGRCHTPGETGREMQLDPGEVRRIEAKALRKARHPRRLQKLGELAETGSAAPARDKASGAGVIGLADLVKQHLEDEDKEPDQ